MTHNRLYEFINIVLSVVSAEEINNENNFPIDFKCQQIWTKNESIEQVIDSIFPVTQVKIYNLWIKSLPFLFHQLNKKGN